MSILITITPIILLFVIILMWIPWRSLFFKMWGDKPDRAKIYVEYGEHVEVCKGYLLTESPKGLIYSYKVYGRNYSVLVPRNYPYRFIFGSREIRVLFGDTVALPLVMANGQPAKLPDVSPRLLDSVLKSHIGRDLVNTVFGKAVSLFMIFVILAILTVGGYYVYRNYLNPAGSNTGIPAQTITPDQAKDLPIPLR